MIHLADKSQCCGCTACMNICPLKCITMVSDEEGFLYPEVDQERCVDCGLCNKVCPENECSEEKEASAKGCVIRHTDARIVSGSSSGGAFSAIAEKVIAQGGRIVGAAYDSDMNVVHRWVDTVEEIKFLRGSKYVQSDLGNIFAQIKAQLDEGVFVCFSGTACQVKGLSLFLRREYKNLLLVDLVCHGVPSPKLWKAYRSFQEKKYGAKIVAANFRDKHLGYQMPTMTLQFENGKQYCATARVDMMLKSFFTHIALRPSCFQCPAKGIERTSDITLFDCWDAEELIGTDDGSGFTAVIVQSSKGEQFLSTLKEQCDVYDVALSALIPANGGGMVVRSASRNPNRGQFYDILERNSLETACRKCAGLSKSDYVVEWFKIKAGSSRCVRWIAKQRRLRSRRKAARQKKTV